MAADPRIAESFRRSGDGFVSRADPFVSCPPYVIASIAASGRARSGTIILPVGCDLDVLRHIKAITGFRDQDVPVSARQAAELARIGAQILALDDGDKLAPPLRRSEKQSVAHLVRIATATPDAGLEASATSSRHQGRADR
jgi:hypothetical protein